MSILQKRFVAIDFETLSEWRGSVCQIAISVIENNKIVESKDFMVCPPSKDENSYCVQTHGIHYEDVKNEPDFKTIWEVIDKEYIKGCPLVAHNAPFEKSCINACADFFGTNSDYFYIDTLQLSRKYLDKLENHKLNTVCEAINHNLIHHHNALDDAIACSNIFIKITTDNELNWMSPKLYDITNKFYLEGLKSEEIVRKVTEHYFECETRPATKYEDTKEHIDFWVIKDEKEFGVDVKGLRKNKRSDKEYDDTINWLEITNVNGNPGWIYGKAVYIAFMTKKNVLFVPRKKLIKLVEEKTKDKQIVNVNPKEFYQPYQRKGRLDNIIKVPTTDLIEIAKHIIDLEND